MNSDKIMKWVGTVFFIVSALLVTSNFELSKWGMVTFLFGHIIFVTIFYKLKDWAMFYQNFFFIFIDLWGIYRWFVIC